MHFIFRKLVLVDNSSLNWNYNLVNPRRWTLFWCECYLKRSSTSFLTSLIRFHNFWQEYRNLKIFIRDTSYNVLLKRGIIIRSDRNSDLLGDRIVLFLPLRIIIPPVPHGKIGLIIAITHRIGILFPPPGVPWTINSNPEVIITVASKIEGLALSTHTAVKLERESGLRVLGSPYAKILQ